MEQGVEPKKETILEKMGVWGSVQCNTLTDRSSSHIADLMIQGSQMGITDITKAKNMLTVADVAASALAEEYIACEQKHITSMQKYL